MADARHLAFANELVRRDERIAEALGTLRALEADLGELRTHAGSARAFVETVDGERARLAVAVEAAAANVVRHEADLAAAEVELATAKEGEPKAAARRAVTRTQDAAGSARRRRARVEAEREQLEEDAARVGRELPGLDARAAALASRLATAPRVSSLGAPEPGLEPLLAWSSHAKAALFVATASLETERERVVREANELVAVALGEPTAATSVRLAAALIGRSG